MGLFLNMGNENFAEFSRTKYFVDKSELINILLKKDITEKFICNSRAFWRCLPTITVVAVIRRIYTEGLKLGEKRQCSSTV